MRAVAATVHRAFHFDTVADHAAFTVGARGRHGVNGTLERIVRPRLAAHGYLEGLVVIVPADVAYRHGFLHLIGRDTGAAVARVCSAPWTRTWAYTLLAIRADEPTENPGWSDKHDKEEAVRNDIALFTGVAIGAGTMFLLDPDRGARRRALVRDKAARAANKTSDGLDALALDITNRTRGAAANLRGRFDRSTPEGRKLIERVRAELGRVVSHPRAVDVSVLHDGCVALTGPILASEADAALAAIAGVRGVTSVEDNLERHDSSEGVPALQGGRIRTGRRTGLLQNSWSPTTQILVALTGTAVAAGVTYAMRGSSPAAAA